MQYDSAVVFPAHYRIKERRMKEEHPDFTETWRQSHNTDLLLVWEGEE